MSTESERLADLIIDVGHRLGQAFGDVISPEAQRHLRNAQREALTALFLIYEERLGRRTDRTTPDAAGDDSDDWPRDMEQAVRWAGAETEADMNQGSGEPRARSRGGRPRPRTPDRERSARVKKIRLD